MSQRRRLHPKTLIQLLIAGLLVLVAIGVVGSSRRGAPTNAPMPVAEGLQPSRDGEASAFVTCQRVLPDRPTLREGQNPPPVGRVRSADVLECPDLFDQRVVTYVGEIVGDILQRRDGAWVLVNDDAYALESGPLHASGDFRGSNSGLSVWLDGDLKGAVDQPGNARWRGDVVRVTGVLHRVDARDGGSLTIRASEVEVLSEAQQVPRPLNRTQAVLAVILTLIAIAVAVYERRTALDR